MWKFQLRAPNAQGFGIVLHSKEDIQIPTSVTPNLLCVCSCSLPSLPLSRVYVGEVYAHKCGRVCKL